MDASDTYYAKVRAARAATKLLQPEVSQQYARAPATSSQSKRQRGLQPPSQYAGHAVMVDDEGNRIISGSEWTDEDAF